MSQFPLVSIVIPTYNREAFILKAIDSVLSQTYQNFEIIVVDDGSTDNTRLILNEFINNKKILYYKTENLGVSHARNLGSNIGVGKYIAFLDSDDEWMPTKLEKQLIFLKLNTDYKIVYTDEEWIRNNQIIIKKKDQEKKSGEIFLDCLKKCIMAPSSVLIEKKLLIQLNGFDESFIVCEDYDLWLKLSIQYKIGYINEKLIIKNAGHTDQLSFKFHSMDFFRIKSAYSIIINHPNINIEVKSKILNFIITKANILIKGQKKHQNFEYYQETCDLLKFSLENL